MHTQLSEAVPSYMECTEPQAVEIRITQQWLKAMAWQLCVCQGLVSSVSNDNCMTFKYPIDISRDLLSMAHQFSQQTMEMHGAELVRKLLISLFKNFFLHTTWDLHSYVLRSVHPCQKAPLISSDHLLPSPWASAYVHSPQRARLQPSAIPIVQHSFHVDLGLHERRLRNCSTLHVASLT